MTKVSVSACKCDPKLLAALIRAKLVVKCSMEQIKSDKIGTYRYADGYRMVHGWGHKINAPRNTHSYHDDPAIVFGRLSHAEKMEFAESIN